MSEGSRSKFFITDKLIEGGVWSSGSAVWIKAIGLITSLLVLRFLSVYEYGLYQLVLSVQSLLAMFFLVGLDQIILADFLRAKGEGRNEVVRGLFAEFAIFKISTGFVLFLLSFFGAGFIGNLFGRDIGLLIRIISFYFLMVALERVLNILFNYNLAFKAMSLYTLTNETLKFLFLLFFIFVAGLGVSGVVLSGVSASVLTGLLFIPVALSIYRKMPGALGSPRRLIWSALVSYGKWAVGFQYMNDLQRNIRPWLIRFFLSTEAVGIYAIAENLYSQAVSLIPFGTVLTPVVSQNINDRLRIRNLVYYGAKYGTLFFLLLAIFSFFAVPWLVRLLFPQHINSIPLFYIILLIMPPAGLAMVFTSIFYAEREQMAHFIIIILTLILTLTLGAALVSRLGIMGMAVEFTVTAYFFNIARAFYLFKTNPELRFSLSSLFRWDREDWMFIKLIGLRTIRFITNRRFS